MAKFEIIDLNPASSTISVPGKVTLKFNMTGNAGAKGKLTYTLQPGNNVFFVKDGQNVKTISQDFALDGSPKPFSDELSIVKSGAPDFPSVFIDINATDADGNPASNKYTLAFS